MMQQIHSQQSGFSLVETLVAITILLIVIAGPLTLVSNSARSTDFANDQVMAFFLAQEGLELVQAERDDLLIPAFFGGSGAWNSFSDTSGILGDCFNANGCSLDQETDGSGSINVRSCADIADCRLSLDTSGGVRSAYNHSGVGTETKYIRVITMNEPTAGQVEVVSTVTWRSDGQRTTQEVQATTYLFDVYDR